MLRHFFISITLTLLTLFATTASADFVDFSASEFQDAGGVNSYTDTDRGFTISAKPDDASITWNSEYGLGVDSEYFGEIPEEIDAWEYLVIDFDETVFLASVDLTNFYNNGSFGNPEIGFYVSENGSIHSFSADLLVANSSTGEQTININNNVSSITFSAWPLWGDSDYSIKGMDIAASGNTSVPEFDAGSSASALALLFGCVLVLNGRRKLTL